MTWENESQNCGFPDFEIFNERTLILLTAARFEKKKKELNNFITVIHSEGRFQRVNAMMSRKEMWMNRTNSLLSDLLG